MAVGAVGDRIRVARAVADGSVSSRFMLGIAAQNITDGTEGYINILGEIRNLDTSAYTVGTVLYIDPASAGNLTDDEPQSPALDQSVAIVTRSHASTGIIFVRMWNQGLDLNEVHDVLITSVANNELLAYDTTSGLWINQTASEAGLVAEGDSRLTDARTPTAHASTHASGGSDAITIAQSQVTDLTTALAGKVDEVNGAVTTASTSSTVVRNITLSTSDPSGGMDGDVWLKYTP
jgi:hypothetical protein